MTCTNAVELTDPAETLTCTRPDDGHQVHGDGRTEWFRMDDGLYMVRRLTLVLGQRQPVLTADAPG